MTYTPEKMITVKSILKEQFMDDRRKLELFFSVKQRALFTPSVNLWTPPPHLSKKDQVRITQEIIPQGDVLSLRKFQRRPPAPGAALPVAKFTRKEAPKIEAQAAVDDDLS